tara:strand:+ start:136 stop:567 length:432 start_codon:yes stop_codon:yes gene_type:complete
MSQKKRILIKQADTQAEAGCSGVSAVLWLTTHPRGLAHLKSKIRGYANQDNKKQHRTNLDPGLILEKLVIAQGKCKYCKKGVWIKDYPARCRDQWTLDRKDNRKGHTPENTVISCLDCNLRRRARPYNSFLRGENLIMRKVGI